MMDFVDGLESKNYGLRKTTDPRSLFEFLSLVLPLIAIAGAFSFHVWVRGQSVQVGYRSQQLSEQADRLEHIQRQLILEEQILKDPANLEALARENLGLSLLKPNQIIPPPASKVQENLNSSLGLKTDPDLIGPEPILLSVDY